MKTASMKGIGDETGPVDRYDLEWISDNSIGTGAGSSGDSGGPIVDADNNIFAVDHGISIDGTTYTTSVTKLSPNIEFILDTINDISYPTSVTGDNATFTVQNLSEQTITLTPAFSGVTASADTCSDQTLSPLGTCTMTVSGSGTVILNSGNVVKVNSTSSSSSSDSSSSSGSSSGGGGSFDYLMLLGLAGCAGLKQFMKK